MVRTSHHSTAPSFIASGAESGSRTNHFPVTTLWIFSWWQHSYALKCRVTSRITLRKNGPQDFKWPFCVTVFPSLSPSMHNFHTLHTCKPFLARLPRTRLLDYLLNNGWIGLELDSTTFSTSSQPHYWISDSVTCSAFGFKLDLSLFCVWQNSCFFSWQSNKTPPHFTCCSFIPSNSIFFFLR